MRNNVTNAPSAAALAGAHACHQMIAGISQLKDVKNAPGAVLLDHDDDGTRRNYAGADRLIAAALDAHANNPGFRQSLANFLLMVYRSDVPDMDRWTAENMLRDDGYRTTSPAEPERTGYDPNQFDFEDAGLRLDGLLHLAHWIERAREMAADIVNGAEHDPAFRAILKARGIAWGNCWWEEEETNGLLQLMRLVWIESRDMAKAGQDLQREVRRG